MLALALSLSLAAPAAPPSALGSPRADEASALGPELAVERGRALLVLRGERPSVLRAEEEAPRSARGWLEVPAGSRVRLSWSGRASVLVEGPSTLEWREAGCDLLALGALELEVRATPFELTLPEAWSARAGAGAYRFRSESGATEVGVRAGDPLVLVPRSAHARPPLVLAAGASLRLGPQLVAPTRVDTLAGARGWVRASWPWHALGADGACTLEPARHEPDPLLDAWTVARARSSARAPSGGARASLASVPEPDGRLADEPAALPAGPRAARDEPVDESREPAPDAGEPQLLMREPAPAPTEPASSDAGAVEPPRAVPRLAPAPSPLDSEPALPSYAPYLASDWRGFERAALQAFAFGMLERVEGLAWTPLEDGLWKLSLASDAPRAAWLLCAERDLHLRPGGSITIDEDGRLRGYQGSVRILPAPPQRPRTDALAPFADAPRPP